jgi:hypothetical protein
MNGMGSLLRLSLAYAAWHYLRAWGDLWRVYGNVSWFLANLFSIQILSKTLFSPWRRLREGTSKGVAGIFGRIIMNTLTRLIGVAVRSGTILCGIFSLVLWTLLSALLLILWVILPFAVVAMILFGLVGIVQSLF